MLRAPAFLRGFGTICTYLSLASAAAGLVSYAVQR
jgi:hypothetical protein